ncbi:hypothetical protein ABVT39_007508 [Epinephelus coioides]
MSVTHVFLHCKVTIDLELHLTRRTKFKASWGRVAHYDVYLYRTPKSEPRTPSGARTKTINGPSRAKSRVLRWEDDTYPPSPPCSICSPPSSRSPPTSSTMWTLSPYAPR